MANEDQARTDQNKQDQEAVEKAKPESTKAKAKKEPEPAESEAREYPDQKGLRQIETERPDRDALATEETKSFESRERTGWSPQSGPSGVIPVEVPVGGQDT